MLSLKDECEAMGISVKEYFSIRRLIEIANGKQVDDELKQRIIATVERRFPEVPVFREPHQSG